jgi:hypothetical protein
MLTRLTTFVLLAMAFVPLVSAQEQKILLQFLAFPKQMEPEPVELRIGEERTIQIKTPGHQLSPTYQVPAMEFISVGETVKNNEGESVFQEYGKTKALTDKRQIILLIRKGPANSDGFAVIPINADLEKYGGGSFTFINASKIQVEGIIGNEKFNLKPGLRTSVTPEPDFGRDICQVTLSYLRGENDWKKLLDARWSANKDSRSLIFFYQIPDTKKLGLAPIVELLESSKS